MKRRITWLRRLFDRRTTAASLHPPSAGVHPMPARVVLRFRDGSSVMLDPQSPAALAMHGMADRWLTGR
jgi:hypothetical protein